MLFGFYVAAPFLVRILEKVRNVYWFLGLLKLLSGMNQEYDLVGLANLSPFGTLYWRVLGLCVAHDYYKNQIMHSVRMCSGYLLLLLILGMGGYALWGGVTALLCCIPEAEVPFEKNKVFSKIVGFLDRNSFIVYLVHLLVADIWTHYVGNNWWDMIFCMTLSFVLSEVISRIMICGRQKRRQ